MKYLMTSKCFTESKTYIKTYEIAQEQLQKNTYVICNTKDSYGKDGPHQQFYDFINNNIGQIIEIINNKYITQYENIPDEIKTYFAYYRDKATRLFTQDIKYYSKSKELLETILNQNKYNL